MTRECIYMQKKTQWTDVFREKDYPQLLWDLQMGHTTFPPVKNTRSSQKARAGWTLPQLKCCTAQHFWRSSNDSSHCSLSIPLPGQPFSPLLLINSHLPKSLTTMYYLLRLWLFPTKNLSYSCTNGEFKEIVLSWNSSTSVSLHHQTNGYSMFHVQKLWWAMHQLYQINGKVLLTTEKSGFVHKALLKLVIRQIWKNF